MFSIDMIQHSRQRDIFCVFYLIKSHYLFAYLQKTFRSFEILYKEKFRLRRQRHYLIEYSIVDQILEKLGYLGFISFLCTIFFLLNFDKIWRVSLCLPGQVMIQRCNLNSLEMASQKSARSVWFLTFGFFSSPIRFYYSLFIENVDKAVSSPLMVFYCRYQIHGIKTSALSVWWILGNLPNRKRASIDSDEIFFSVLESNIYMH